MMTPEERKHKRYDTQRKYDATPKGRASKLLRCARYRAKKDGIQCTLTREWVLEKLKLGRCEVTNLEFELKPSLSDSKANSENPWSPSIDRIDPDGDYTPENSRLTVWIFNQARGSFDDDALMTMARALTSYPDGHN
jgi:hypothetical protein